MRKLQDRIPFLSESERAMKRELENIEERLETYQRSLEQVGCVNRTGSVGFVKEN